MKQAFTLIELLVVIAIIAILAALLFPVFAAARTSAKKTVAVSGQRQISTALLLYMSSHDDMYPRQDSCSPGSSLNPELNKNPFNYPGTGCTIGGFYYRSNHFSWQKYLMPYVKTVKIFEHPLREKDPFNWDTHGQINGSYALNLGFTGSWDTDAGLNLDKLRANRSSFTGGSTSGIPDPSRAGILMESAIGQIGIVPTMTYDGPGADLTGQLTAYPVAVREYWRYKLMEGTVEDCVDGKKGLEPDPRKVAAGGIIVGFADGSAKFMKAKEFLAKTPTKAEIFAGGSYTFGNDCSNFAGNIGFSNINPNLDYPLWGLQRN
jgi:prepilin-type N-terminal cleavage/methylation domain-containing protein